MTGSDPKGALRRISEELEYLAGFTRSRIQETPLDIDALLDAFVKLQRSLARDLQVLAEQVAEKGPQLLDRGRASVEAEMRLQFVGKVPEKYLAVKGYRGVHGQLLAFLAMYVGRPVPGSKLRMLTADQVHTERRVRELRDLGYRVTAKRVSGDNQYVLEDLEPDTASAAPKLVRRNMTEDKSLDERERAALLQRMG